MPMPSKRRSLVVQTSMDAYTPPGERPPPSASPRRQRALEPRMLAWPRPSFSFKTMGL